jgi:hypothetical protein
MSYTVHRIEVRVNTTAMGETDDADRDASIYAGMLEEALAEEFPGADIRVGIDSGHTLSVDWSQDEDEDEDDEDDTELPDPEQRVQEIVGDVWDEFVADYEDPAE